MIESSSGGADALARVEAAPNDFGLVLCDLQMPGMDGVEFVRHLAAMGYSGGLVLISGAAPRLLQTVEQLALRHGLDVRGTLRKPVEPGALRAMLAPRHPESAQESGANASPASLADVVALEKAIVAGELFNEYQPRIDLHTGEVVGMRALARWQHGARGIMAEDDFLPLVERNPLAMPLARATVANALHDAKVWSADQPGLDMVVKFSVASFQDLGVPDRLTALCEAAGFPMQRLVLVLSEARLPLESPALLDILSRLRLKGVRLVIDEFGTGFSNLAHWADLPFSELEIDRSFVGGVARDTSRRAIVQATLALARELDVLAVAKGVDDPEDLVCLRALGCNMGQGAALAEPMPASAVPAWLEAWPQRRERVLAAAGQQP